MGDTRVNQHVSTSEHQRPGLTHTHTLHFRQVLDPEHQSKGDTKEGYYIGREVSADSEEARKFPLHGPNQWPDEAAVGLPGWRAVMERYFAALQDLGLRTVRLLLRALELPEDHLGTYVPSRSLLSS